jgi:hypothetical protein
MDPSILISPGIPPTPDLAEEPEEVSEATQQTLLVEVPDADQSRSADAPSLSTQGTILHKQVGDSMYTYVIDSAGEVWCWSPKSGEAQRLRGI